MTSLFLDRLPILSLTDVEKALHVVRTKDLYRYALPAESAACPNSFDRLVVLNNIDKWGDKVSSSASHQYQPL